jgi:hypothetical protein
MADIYALATDTLVNPQLNGAAWATADQTVQAATAAGTPRVPVRGESG